MLEQFGHILSDESYTIRSTAVIWPCRLILKIESLLEDMKHEDLDRFRRMRAEREAREARYDLESRDYHTGENEEQDNGLYPEQTDQEVDQTNGPDDDELLRNDYD
uniref:Uncharacterized protein n=1 Tax=Cacopsylla melanoneura TaxID=428564 RepID=A0A8D8R152_9HEMI